MPNEMVTEVRLIKGDSVVKASAEVTLQTDHGELTLSKLKVIQQDGKEPWVAYPKIQYQDKATGEMRYIKTMIPGVRLKNAVSESVLANYAKALGNETPF